jgi:uncharacterized SAM-binding protein YcdF (DUF218 family)
VFYLSKLSFLVVQPLYWLVFLLIVGLVIAAIKPSLKFSRWVLGMGLVLTLLIGWTPLSNAVLRSLEDRFQPPSGELSGYVGIIVLGGVFAGNDGRNREQISLGCSADRVVVPVPLMNQYPHLRLLFTGGEAALVPTGQPEALAARRYFERMGLDASRIVYEDASRNTYENAELSRRLPGVDAKGPWLLVTSASHMPRAHATFVRSGWNVTAYPVDYASTVDASPFNYSLVGGAGAWKIALREFLGLFVYRVTGKA